MYPAEPLNAISRKKLGRFIRSTPSWNVVLPGYFSLRVMNDGSNSRGMLRFAFSPSSVSYTHLAPEFENLDLAIRVDKMVKNLNSVVMSPDVQYVIDDAVFAEFDSDTARCV